MKIKIKERDLQRQILDWLAIKHIFHYRNNSGALKTEGGGFVRFGTPGSPDIVCVIRGLYVGVEIKGTGGRLSDHQKAFQEALVSAGGVYIVAFSLEDVISKLK